MAVIKPFLAGVCVLMTSGAIQAQSAPENTLTDPATFAALRGNLAADSMSVNCTIKPLQSVEVSVPLPGIVAEVFVRPGMQVSEGAPLLALDDTLLRREFALAQSRAAGDATLNLAVTRRDGLARKEARLARARARNAVSVAEHEAAALELASAEGDILRERESLELARLEMERVAASLSALEINSPVTGVVGEDLINVGEAAGREHVATIYVNQPLRVEAFVPSAFFGKFVEQTKYSVIVNGSEENARLVEFDYAAQLADLASNTISVFFRLTAPDVLPGSKCMMTTAGGAGSSGNEADG